MDERCFDKTPAYAGCGGDAKNMTSGPLMSGTQCPPSAGRPAATFGNIACGTPESVFDRANRLTEQALDETFKEGLDIGRAEGIAEMRGRIAAEADIMLDELLDFAMRPVLDPNDAETRDSIVDAFERLLTLFESL